MHGETVKKKYKLIFFFAGRSKSIKIASFMYRMSVGVGRTSFILNLPQINTHRIHIKNTQTYAKIQLLLPRLCSFRIVYGDISKVTLYTDSSDEICNNSEECSLGSLTSI